MVRGQHKTAVKELLSPAERQSLQEEKAELQSTLREVQGGAGEGTSRSGAIDTNNIQRQIQNIDAQIEARTPEVVRGKSLDNLIRDERELEDLMAEGMPTKYEMDNPSKCPGAVRKHLAWLSRNNKRIEAYVRIQKTIRPEEPKSVEALRKDR